MELLQVGAYTSQSSLVSRVASEIRRGSVIIYPTDTVYGIGCSIKAVGSVKRVYEIKGRAYDKPLSVLFSSLEEVRAYAKLSPKEEEYIREHMSEPYTFVVKKKRSVPSIVTGGLDTVGVRIINLDLVKEILVAAGVPIITTSANLSGEKPPVSVEEINRAVLEKVDLVLDSGPCRIGRPSTVLEISSGKVLRDI